LRFRRLHKSDETRSAADGNNLETFYPHVCKIRDALERVSCEKMDVFLISCVKLASLEHVTLRSLNIKPCVFCHVLLARAENFNWIWDVGKNILCNYGIELLWQDV